MLQIKDLSVQYSDRMILEGLNLEFAPGEIHGVLGMNGAGKTTLFRTIYGLKPKSKGKIIYQDLPIKTQDVAYLETELYFYSYLKGKEYLEILQQRHQQFNSLEWNEIFRLPLEQLVDSYSTGMKKKLAFLGILSLDRPIIILDEPFNGLDIESTEIFFQILLRLMEMGKIIILSSHIFSSLTDICDKISYLNGGYIQNTYSKEQFTNLEQEIKLRVKDQIDSKLDLLLRK